MFYFVRVNGDTLHNNPNLPDYYVPNEPPLYPMTKFNALNFCLEREIIRIGWPDTGDLSQTSKTNSLANGYSFHTLKPYVQNYLQTFRDIEVGSIILMPDTAHPGEFYMGEVIRHYHYFHDVPREPYEHSHRLGVRWDKKVKGQHRVYRAANFGIHTQGGGFWRRAFAAIERYDRNHALIPTLQAARENP